MRQLKPLSLLTSLAVAVSLPCVSRAQKPPTAVVPDATLKATAVPVPTFRAGDSVTFVGDSITFGGAFHNLIYLFYATRFPESRFEIHNTGLSGYTAERLLPTVPWNIAPTKPTVASVMLGMNDLGRGYYTVEKPGTTAQKEQAFTAYGNNMRKLVGQLRDLEARVILITPTNFDDSARLEQQNAPGFTAALARGADDVRKIAAEFALPVIDFNGPMNALTAAGQKSDPAFTLTTKDRVHPSPMGHMIMAYLFLRAQGMPSLVSRVDIDVSKKQGIVPENCTVTVGKSDRTQVEFTQTAWALPFPVTDTYQPALALVPFQQELNREIVRVRGLETGSYQLLIDDAVVGTHTASELAAGIDLGANPLTPQYKQALDVMRLNDQRHNIVRNQLRVLAQMRASALKNRPEPGTMEETRKIMEEYLESVKTSPSYNYTKGVAAAYLEWLPKEKESLAALKEVTDRLWAANRPVAHRYRVVRK